MMICKINMERYLKIDLSQIFTRKKIVPTARN